MQISIPTLSLLDTDIGHKSSGIIQYPRYL